MCTNIRSNLQRNYIIVLIPFVVSILLVISGCGGGGGGGSAAGAAISSIPDNPPPPSQTGSITLTWDAPTTNSDDSPLTDLAGYIIYYGTSSGNYSNSVDVGNSTGTSISNLSLGLWCVAITAYDTSGNESVYSNEQCKTLS